MSKKDYPKDDVQAELRGKLALLAEIIREKLEEDDKEGDTIIELGSGYGHDSIWLAERQGKLTTVECELSPEKLHQLKELRAEIERLLPELPKMTAQGLKQLYLDWAKRMN